MWSVISIMTLIISVTQFYLTSQERSFSLRDQSMDMDTKEYCLNEVFEARCLSNEVIVMNSATYGRMRIGRCLEAEGDVSSFGTGPDFLGCYVNVLPVFDKRCSLRNRCEVGLAIDVDLQKQKPCHVALVRYLEASYDCLTVIEEDRSCVVSVSTNPLHLMHPTSNRLNCGTKTQPWVIEAPLGQQINISLLDFASQTRDVSNHQHSGCQQYGYIIDKSSRMNTSVCGLDQTRKSIVYKSTSNVVEVVLSLTNELKSIEASPRYLIIFEAIGCLNLVPPEDTWLSRKDREAIVGCYSSRQTWTLRCIESKWIGVIGNCTRETAESEISITFQEKSLLNNTAIVAVAIGVFGLLICATIVICGVLCLKRYSTMNKCGYHQKIEIIDNGRVTSTPVLNTCTRSELLG